MGTIENLGRFTLVTIHASGNGHDFVGEVIYYRTRDDYIVFSDLSQHFEDAALRLLEWMAGWVR